MNNNEQFEISALEQMDERIERFIRNQMTEEEEQEFRQDIKSDEELRIRTYVTATMAKGMKKLQKEEAKKIIDSCISNNEHQIRYTKLRWVVSIAALFIVVFGGYFGYNEYDYHKRNVIVAEYIINYQSARGTGETEIEEKLKLLAVTIQRERDMTSAISELQLLYAKRKTDLACIQNSTMISWNLALAYFKQNKKEKARAILINLKKEEPSTTKKVNALLNKIN